MKLQVDAIPSTAEAAGADIVLRIDELSIAFDTDEGTFQAVSDLSLQLHRGEILAIVGESGSGKTVTARAIIDLLPRTARVDGTIEINGARLDGLSPQQLRALRGGQVGYVFQEPSAALNPVRTVGWQIAAGLRAQTPGLGARAARLQAIEALRQVGIPEPESRVDHYPHQFSGGQKQRIVIASVVALGASVIVADEPTTALDVTVQAEILALLRRLRDELGTSIIIVTHNMGVVSEIADRVVVMNHGRIVEEASVRELFHAPQNEYTKSLVAAVTQLGSPRVRSVERQPDVTGHTDAPVIVRQLQITFPGRFTRPSFTALRGIDLEIRRGEVYGLVGESGSGKTTLGRAIAGLTPVSQGSLTVLGHELSTLSEKRLRPVRRRIGVVFQDPAASFDPHLTIGASIGEPLDVHLNLSTRERDARVAELLDAVQLDRRYARSYAHELSGGQRQRASLARALALDPELVIADEPTSALDVSVQARVLELFRTLQSRLGFAALFISHDLAVVESVAHRVGVLYRGELVEEGDAAQVLRQPQHPYTAALVAAFPVPATR